MATLDQALAAAATLIAVAFALSTLERWQARRRRHELAWTLSLGMFAVASGALWVGVTLGWDEPTFRAFFLFGAILNVPWLALGSVYLLYGQRTGDRWAVAITLFSLFATGVVVATPFVGPLEADGLPRGKDVFEALPRLLAGIASGVAAVAVVGLALVSAYRLLRGRRRGRAAGAVARPGRLAVGNLLIAAGTLVLGASGSLNARLGEMRAFLVTLVTGVAILFVGFLVATSASGAPRPDGTVAEPPPDASPAPVAAGDGSAQGAPEHLAGGALR